jgi:hypothetical protein
VRRPISWKQKDQKRGVRIARSIEPSNSSRGEPNAPRFRSGVRIPFFIIARKQRTDFAALRATVCFHRRHGCLSLGLSLVHCSQNNTIEDRRTVTQRRPKALEDVMCRQAGFPPRAGRPKARRAPMIETSVLALCVASCRSSLHGEIFHQQ